ncbi:protein-tyrosine sulfotransferase [Paragonimus westermani]|uniref:Protein-tyrosine sulfotransferase n=1 Tax=Paragonimus westermani TaxID=34504 RepID=A0A5J4NH84_9TREM|nr:protein-tyrosine sulfotransferase [Paragonimus westermani]
MLDAHPLIRCGAEPLVTFDLLKIRHSKNDQWKRVAKEAGVYPEVYDHAVAAFILKVIEEMGPPAEYLCHKEPVTTPYFKYLAFLFPKAKFVHVLRDGRGAVASSIARHLIVGGKGSETERALKQWETMVKTIMKDCNDIGLDRCINIRYEKLVLESELEMKKLFSEWKKSTSSFCRSHKQSVMPDSLKHPQVLHKLTWGGRQLEYFL